MKKTLVFLAVSSALATPAAFAAVPGLDAAASGFSDQFVASAAVIGGAMIVAAFGAIVWKWIKAMIFGG